MLSEGVIRDGVHATRDGLTDADLQQLLYEQVLPGFGREAVEELRSH